MTEIRENLGCVIHHSIKYAVDNLRSASESLYRHTRGEDTAGVFREDGPDILDFLQERFGFQDGNVKNQRDSLITLISERLHRFSEREVKKQDYKQIRR